MKYLQTFRLHPSPEQAAKIRERFALAGDAYNWGLAETERVWEEERRHLSLFDIKDCYRQHFNYEQHRPITSAEMNALNNLDFAYTSYFKGLSARPRAKEPDQMVSFTEMASAVLPRSDSRHLHIPKIGLVPCNFYRPIQHEPTQVTIKERNGKFFAVLLADLPEQPCTEPKPEVVGIDLGLKTFATLSDGKEIPFPDHIWNRRAERREAHLQRVNKRRQEGSRRQQKVARCYARFMEHKANQVKDFHLKTAVRLCQDYGAIAVEHLNVESMKQGHKCHARNNDFQHYGLTAFLRRLRNRCARTGTPFLQIGRFEPTTRLCHHCGYLLPHALPLDQREWTCPKCHTTHQRDLNAAFNIQALGQRILSTLPPVERKVTTVERTERPRREAVKVAEKPKAEPRPACTLGASKHNVTRLAPKPISGDKADIQQFIWLVTSNIRPEQISRIMGMKYTNIIGMRYHGVSIEWRRQDMLDRCNNLRQTLIIELQNQIYERTCQPIKEYVIELRDNLNPWLRWKNIISIHPELKAKLSKKNEAQWREYVGQFIQRLRTLTIVASLPAEPTPSAPTPAEQSPQPAKHPAAIEPAPQPEAERPQPFYASIPSNPDHFSRVVQDCLRPAWLSRLTRTNIQTFNHWQAGGTDSLTPETAPIIVQALRLACRELQQADLNTRRNSETMQMLDLMNQHNIDLTSVARTFIQPYMMAFDAKNRTAVHQYNLNFCDLETAIRRELPAYIRSLANALAQKFQLQAA